MERQIGLIAEGKAEKEAVVLHTLDQFAQKFRHFVTRIARMDALFEASFSPLASSGELNACDAWWCSNWSQSCHRVRLVQASAVSMAPARFGTLDLFAWCASSAAL